MNAHPREVIRLPGNELLTQYANDAFVQIRASFEKIRDEQERKEAMGRLTDAEKGVYQLIGQLPDNQKRTFLEQEQFCKKVDTLAAELKQWLKGVNNYQQASTISQMQSTYKTQVRTATSMANA